MTTDINPVHVPSREQIERLQAHMIGMPQAELDTEHYFSGGMYCRKVFRKAGTLIVGKVHKADHIFMCALGEIAAWSENGMRVLRPGDVIESKAGTKRVTLALTDAIGVTIHKTDNMDLDTIEAELIEHDPTALFDARNQIIGLIEGKPL
jgi:quercetin dioxygenase-like cupin family protein